MTETYPLHNPLDPIESLLQRPHLGTIAETNKVMARTIKQVSSFGRIEVEEDARNNNHVLLEAFLEKIKSIANRRGHSTEVQPDVKGRVGHIGFEPNLSESAQYVVPLGLEVRLQRLHLSPHVVGFEHRDGRFLKRHVRAAIEIGATGADRADEFFRTDDPCDAPSRQSEPLRQTVQEQDVIVVHVFDVIGRTHGRSVTVARVVVATIELIHDERCSITTNVLNLGQLGILDDMTRRVARVGRQDDRRASGDFFGDFIGMDMIPIRLGQRRRDGRKLIARQQWPQTDSVMTHTFRKRDNISL